MKVSVLIIVVVIHGVTCEKAASKLKKKLLVPKVNENCKKIKCPTIEDPQCVRMRRHDLSLTFHTIVTNKCELEYLNCHDDVEGKIVPMKFCGHNAVLTAEKNKNKKGKAHIRVKREFIHSESSAELSLREAAKQETSTSTPAPAVMQFGRYDHPIKDPWNTAMWDKVPRDLLLYLIM